MSSSIPSFIFCGSQTIPPTGQALDQLASYLLRSPNLKPLVEGVLDLPELLTTLKKSEPRLQVVPNGPVISLRDWLSPPNSLTDGANHHSRLPLTIPDILPNVLLAPLTVLLHLAQYMQFLDGLGQDDGHDYILEAAAAHGRSTELVFKGLCIGALSAEVLTASPTKETLSKNAAASVKLAMCIGAYVDCQRYEFMSNDSETNSTFRCVAARWDTDRGRDTVNGILKSYPEAFISVKLDESSVTITAPASDLPGLQESFSRNGVRTTKVPVIGRYHSEKNEEALQGLLNLCCPSSGSLYIPWGDKLEKCLRSILIEPADWFSDVATAISALALGESQKVKILELGLASCLPSSLSAQPHLHIIRGSLSNHSHAYKYPDNSVAIIGAACNYPGADSLDQLWDIISTGSVMYGSSPPGRFGKETVTGNFVSNVDQFDCGLFGISPREATYMDPQQRIALQVAYQAVESSGYFGFGFAAGSPDTDADVGCYVGVGSSDYEGNANSKPSTAYSFTGTSRSFISGRISHYFKWTGPSITIDTACSSSAVAIHHACNGIAVGDCSIALAGGVHIMSSLSAHNHIAAAGMTNPNRPCRPFDADAAGYCRGEGCGFIVLKRLSAALADGDDILGVILASATNQSNGSSSITVPVSKCQTDLYRRALSRAAMSPTDISYVETHGTGTQRGDPVEYQSVQNVFCGSTSCRTDRRRVHIGSIKANIGHTEAGSGVAGILKVLLMLKHGVLPPQANFASLNPAIPRPSQGPDQLAITTSAQHWNTIFRAACVNSYGASGNNTAIILSQPPLSAPGPTTRHSVKRYPFLISAHSKSSMQRYCQTLADYIENKAPSLPKVAYLVARQQNRHLPYRIVFSAESLLELQSLLRGHSQIGRNASLAPVPNRQLKPVVLVFGGQTGSTLYFSKEIYDASYALRRHINKCDAIIQEMGLPSVFPDIFSRGPVDEVVMLHCCLFCIQYACAMAWLDAGLVVARVIGHSFGQLTAMCISGVVSLEDALRLVAGRAEIIRDCWGNEKGCMLAVEIDREGAEALTLSDNENFIEVACYNGPYTHVLVGNESASSHLEKNTPLPTRRLKTTHAFHSRLFDSLIPQYLELAQRVTYRCPTIPIETCSQKTNRGDFSAKFVVEHSREPVYFSDAVRRIERDLGPCIWLEAGSGSSTVSLARLSLSNRTHTFCGLQLGSSGRKPLEFVVDATLELWRQGLSVQCWLYHPRETSFPGGLHDLPRYQFDQSSHWLSCTEHATAASRSSSLRGQLFKCHPQLDPDTSLFKLLPEDPGLIRTSITALRQSSGIPNNATISPETAASSSGLREDGRSNVWSTIKAIILDLTRCYPEQVSTGATMVGMGMDSLAVMELKARIRDVLHVDVPYPIYTETTLGEIYDRVTLQQNHDLVDRSSKSTTMPSWFTPLTSGSSSFESDTETEDSEAGQTNFTVRKLIELVAAHVRDLETVLPSSQLHSLGLDSLAMLDLESDLKVIFGRRIHLMHIVNEGTTLGGLHALLVRHG
ncbi:uncharacterized protein BDV17DRAFT_288352 [Aspergillus undulatus]|uniref:uncharacterized protein n=1 Tax=Aspergillus undulatus TaxID=1810928 RepID=UPI003CCC9829